MKKILRIMIVDDNPRARGALSAFLSTKESFQIVGEASNGKEAIENVECFSPDVILVDIQMPFMGGLEATRIIKAKWPQIKIIVLTMYPKYQPEALKAGADAFLVKGCPVDELISSVGSLKADSPEGSGEPKQQTA